MSDLWLPGDSFNIGYMNIRDSDSPSAIELRPKLERLWVVAEAYLDRRFREEFARQPHARFWELWLAFRIVSERKPLVRRDARSERGPDFLVDDPMGPIWIEAVTMTRGADGNPDQVRMPRIDGIAQSVPLAEVELRISNAFDVKSSQMRKYKEDGLINPADRTLIAINPGEITLETDDYYRGSPLRVLYPLGDEVIRFHPSESETASGQIFRSEIHRASGASVPIGRFTREQDDHISGVAWSRTTLGNLSQGGHPIVFFPNLTPASALPPRWIPWDIEWEKTSSENGHVTLTPIPSPSRSTV